MQLKSILCPIDFSDFSVAAYRYTLSLAEYYQARLVCLHVVELWQYPFADYAAYEVDYAKFSRAINEGGEKRLREFVNKHSVNGIRPDLVVQQGNASDCILSFAQARNMELIVMGTHGRRGFDRMVLGSTTDRVMRKAACPVLVVSNPSQNVLTTGPDGRHRLSRILYCTDFSLRSERALDYAISLAAEYSAELTMLHVAEDAPDLASAEALIATRTEQLDRLIPDDKRGNLKLKTAVRVGKPYEEIVRHAGEAQISLIAMTARGGDALNRAVFGSTTYRVIQLGPCPVLAIHT
ncbi:MAG TPA: universal stress protein [Terriglobales bacterium]|nr:universal stress protein [Terriglobales bacterium]